MTRRTHFVLPAAHTLTVVGVDQPVHVQQQEDPSIAALLADGVSRTFGPYSLTRNFILVDSGDATVTMAEADAALTPDQAALVADIPTEDQEDGASVWNDAGALKVSTAP